MPELAEWLNVLEEMSQLKTLILRSASPIAPLGTSLSFDIERTITLPSLSHFDLSASLRNCALALAHLDLPALAHLSVTTRARRRGGDDTEVHGILPYVALHAQGPQDIQPLQSMLINTNDSRIDVFAWTRPDINFDVRDSSAFLDLMHSSRVTLSVTRAWSINTHHHTRVLEAAMAALPLDNLVTLAAPHCTLLDEQFWRRHAPQWRMLQCVWLSFDVAHWFRRTLLDANGEHECSLLPSLVKLVLVDSDLTGPWIFDLCDILILKRVEQGVPLEVVDMRTCTVHDHAAIQHLRKLGVDVWGPTEESIGTREPFFITCYEEARGLLVPRPKDIDPDSDFDEDNFNASDDEEGSDLEDNDDFNDDLYA